MGPTREALVKKQVRKYLNEIGAYVFMPVQMGMGAATLDFICCYKGRFVAIETKAAGKKPTPRQMLIAQFMHGAGAIVIFAWSVDDVKQALTEAGLVASTANVNKCPACQRMFKDGATCAMGGCPMGGDV